MDLKEKKRMFLLLLFGYDKEEREMLFDKEKMET